MQEKAYHNHLKSKGKKDHVIAELVTQVRRFEDYLNRERSKTLDSADLQDLLDFSGKIEQDLPGSTKIVMRGIALYYAYCGQTDLASAAAGLREQQTAKSRKAFLLKDFRGVDPVAVTALAAAGIHNVSQLIAAGGTPQARALLADQTGLALHQILELVKLADLSRLGGLKTIRARLYYDAGFDTLEKIAAQDPEQMRAAIQKFVQRAGFDGIPPLPKEALHTVEAAKKLPRLVIFE